MKCVKIKWYAVVHCRGTVWWYSVVRQSIVRCVSLWCVVYGTKVWCVAVVWCGVVL